MEEYTFEIKRLAHRTLFLLAGMLGITVLVRRPDLFWGLFLGGLSSLIYLGMLAQRIKRASDLPMTKALGYMRSGWFFRLSFVALVLALSLLLPNVNYLATVVGIFTVQIVIHFEAAVVVGKYLWQFCRKQTR